MRDSDGEEIEAGDWVRFSYGIPPVGVKARVVDRDGKLIVLTPGHNPEECTLKLLRWDVGEFYKMEPAKGDDGDR